MIQALDSESIMSRFHSIYEKLNRVLVKTPFGELKISDEVKDDVTSSSSSSSLLVELLLLSIVSF